MRKLGIALLGAGLVLAGLLFWLSANHVAHSYQFHACNCDQQIASAVYFALNQVDCDGNYETGAACQDDLNLVTVAPRVSAFHLSDGETRVDVAVAMKGGSINYFSVWFDKAGVLSNAKAD